MAKAPPQESLTPADELRSMLADCERALGQLHGSGSAAINVLHGLDRATALLAQLSTTGVDLRSEQTRFATLQAQLRTRAGAVVKELRASGGLAQARRAVQPDRGRWWWYLDEEVRGGRLQALRRLSLILAGGLALVALGILLYQRFWAPDPVTVRVAGLQFEAEMLASEGQYAGALALLQEAQSHLPDDAQIRVWRGALNQMIGQEVEAAELFAAARPLFEDATAFHLARGQTYLQLQQLDQAFDHATIALRESPQSPSVHFLLGVVLETRGEVSAALAAYEQASLLAEAQGQTELTAVVRVRMAFLLQQAAIPGFAGAQR